MEQLKPSQENRHETLKNNFLESKITPLDFRDAILNLDQEGNHTENAEANIELLEDKEVFDKVEKLATENPEVLESYKKLLAFSYFHKGQGSLDSESFNKAEEILREIDNKSDWYLYVRGTRDYFNNNLINLESALILFKDKNSINYKILERLVSSLKRNDKPQEKYLEVYSQN